MLKSPQKKDARVYSAPCAALSPIRICDFTGQLAGAGATKTLATFGAQVIRVEDRFREGRWDIFRGSWPFVDDRRGIEFGGPFNNHNVEKLGVTLDMRRPGSKDILAELISISDVVTENFSKGVLVRWGFSYEEMTKIKPDIIYVSNCGWLRTCGAVLRVQDMGANSPGGVWADVSVRPTGYAARRIRLSHTWTIPAVISWQSRSSWPSIIVIGQESGSGSTCPAQTGRRL